MSDTEELLGRVRKHLGAPGSRLPALRVLARTLHTSPTRVHAAVRQLVEIGLVAEVGSSRKRYYVGFSPGEDVVESRPGESAVDLLRHELLRGRLRVDVGEGLPSIKELAGRFGYGSRTVSRALRKLESEGLVRRRGKRYALESGDTSGSAGSSLHIVGPPRLLHAFNHGPLSAISEIERGVLRRGRQPVRFLLDSTPERMVLPPEHCVSSFVYIVSGKPREWINRLNQVPRVPLVVIDGTGNLMFETSRKNCFLIRTENYDAGRTVGLCVIERGHRHIAYIPATPHVYKWQTERETALRETCALAGDGASVTTFPVCAGKERFPTARELLGWSKTPVRLILASSGVLPFEAVHERIRPLEALDLLPAMKGMLQPTFDRAYRDSSITAWVCANDEVAVLAMHYLREKGPDALQRISLVGFDNSPISYVMKIASYEFDFQAMGRLALETIAHPDLVRRSEGRVVTVRGHVVVRESLRDIICGV